MHQTWKILIWTEHFKLCYCVADETHKRITLLPERLHEDSKVALKNIFGSVSNVLEELSNKEANDILVRASPKEVSSGITSILLY
jgi:hypothetical protein